MTLLKKVCSIFIFFTILCFPELSIQGSKDGLLLWYDTVVPTLLPFIILTNTLVHINAISCFTYLLYPLYCLIPHLLKPLASLFVIGFFCGYPMGAKMIDDFIENGSLSKQQGLFLLCICNNASPMFLIGYVATAILKRSIPLSVFLFCIYAPIFLFFILGILFSPNLILESTQNPYPTTDLSKNEMDIMADSFAVILKIGGYMMLFSILANFLSTLPIPDYPLRTFLLGVSEVTTGIRYLSLLPLSQIKKTALIGAAASFGGLSSAAQTKSVLSKSKLSIFPYIMIKMLLSYCTYWLIIAYFHYFL